MITVVENGLLNIVGIEDLQNYFMIVTRTAMDMESTYQELSEKGPIQPYVLIV